MATYYVKTGGSDAADGLSDVNAWATIAKVNGETFGANDQILFNRGDVWREELIPPSSGGPGVPITFGAYGTGDKPRISGLDIIGGTWTDIGSNRWTQAIADPYLLLFDNLYGREQSSQAAVTNSAMWHWDSGTLTIYATSDPGSSGLVLEGGSATHDRASLVQQSYLTFDNINFDGAKFYAHQILASVSNLTYTFCEFRNSFLSNFTPNSGFTITDVLLEDCFSTQAGTVGFLGTSSISQTTIRRCTSQRDGMIPAANDRGTGGHGWGGGIRIVGNGTVGGSQNILIEDTLVEYAGVRWDSNITQELDYGWGIWFDTCVATPGNENIIRDNTVRYGSAGGLFCEISDYSNWYRNLAYENRRFGLLVGGMYHVDNRVTANNKFYHLTLVRNGIANQPLDANMRFGEGITPTGAQLTNNEVRNVICHNSQSGVEAIFSNAFANGTWGSGNSIGYLCFNAEATDFVSWDGTNYATYSAWETAVGSPLNYVNANPFLNAPPDYTLQSVSLCRDAGVVLPGFNDGYFGSAPDLGYSEFVSGVTLPFLPNEAAATYLDQAEPDSEDFEYLLAGHRLSGVVADAGVTESDPTGMSVDVAAGTVRYLGGTVGVTSTPALTIPAADPTNARFDVVYWRASDGNVAVEPGTPAPNPVLPTPLTGDGVQLAAVYVPAAAGQIFNADILDKRVFVPEATVFNVKDYGATGDGVTDDTTVIQTAIDGVPKPGGGTVFFPTGTYRITSTLTGQEGVRLFGSGVDHTAGTAAAATIKNEGTGVAITFTGDVTQANSSNFSVENLKIMGQAGTSHGILIDKGQLCKVYNCHIDGHDGDGIRITGAGNIGTVVDRCRIQGNDNGIHVDNVATTAYISHNRIEDNASGSAGIKIDNADLVVVRENLIESNDGKGLWAVGPVVQLKIEDNWFESNDQVDTGDEDILLGGTSGNTISRVFVAGNRLNSTGVGTSLKATYCSDGLFEANQFTPGGITSVDLDANSGDNLFLWNRIFGTYTDNGILNLRFDYTVNDLGIAPNALGRFNLNNNRIDENTATSGVNFRFGTGTPEGNVTASPGSVFLRTDGGSGTTFYVKETGGFNPTGWVAK